MIRCLHCGAETSNGLALCDLCRKFAETVLTMLPIYFRNLARWRPGRAGSRPVPGSRVLYDGERSGGNDKISDRLDSASNALVTWARMLSDDRHIELPTADTEADQVTVLCQWFTEHLTSIATLDWCGQFLRTDHRQGEEFDGIGYHEWRLRRLTEESVPGWYAGACARRVSMESLCGAPTYVVPGFTWVTCSRCGATTHAADHLETILDEARGWVATPKRLAEAIVAMVDTEESVDGLRKRIAIWGNRERIAVYRPSDYAVKRYQLGEVLDRLLAKGATRTDLLPRERNAC